MGIALNSTVELTEDVSSTDGTITLAKGAQGTVVDHDEFHDEEGWYIVEFPHAVLIRLEEDQFREVKPLA